MIPGVPGESHALEIARRNGLTEEIAEKAENYLTGAQADISALIKGLTAKYEELDELEKKRRSEESALHEKRRSVDLKELRLRQKELELREQGYRKLAAFADESRKKLENLVRVLREGEITKDKTRAVKDFIADLSDSIEEEKSNIEKERESLTLAVTESQKQLELEKKQMLESSGNDGESKSESMKKRLAGFAGSAEETHVPDAFAEGLDVFYKDRRGTLLREQGRGTWVVAFGTLKLTLKQKELVLAPVAKRTASVSLELAPEAVDDGGIKGASFGIVQPSAAFELRLLGMRYEEAMKALEKQIDLAVLQHLKTFSVVHGKGHGILQQGVQNYLKTSPVVESFCFAPAEDGGFGKTYVTLKE